jgi:hypothetical protein
MTMKNCRKLPERKKLRSEIVDRVVSLVHAVIAFQGAFRALAFSGKEEPWIRNRVGGHGAFPLWYNAFSTGYFIYDSAVLLWNWKPTKENYQFLAHHLICAFLYGYTARPWLVYYGMAFLIWELSTPFLNLRWILIQYEQVTSPLFHFSEAAFAITFFVARILWGLYISLYCWSDMIKMFNQGRTHGISDWIYLPIFTLLLNIVMNGLNIVWFMNIVKKLRRHKLSEFDVDELRDVNQRS